MTIVVTMSGGDDKNQAVLDGVPADEQPAGKDLSEEQMSVLIACFGLLRIDRRD